MQKYICSVCGYVYDEEIGIVEAGIERNTKWEELPDDWVCPICGATKSEFEIQDKKEESENKNLISVSETSSDMKEMSPLEVSALCTNLARGCEKQYKAEQAVLFNELGVYFKKVSVPAENPDLNKLIELIEKNLNEDIPKANAAASSFKDRGGLRALVWNEKVTRILKSILIRYQKLGDAMLENTGVYVCTICGFIYIGDNLPEICPVCKVPNWKFEKIEGGRANV